MKTIWYLNILIVLTMSIGCNTKSDDKGMYTDKLKIYYQTQDSIFLSRELLFDEGISYDDSQFYHYTEKDIESSLNIAFEGLEKEGFKPLSREEFLQKVKEVWKITIPGTCSEVIEHKNFFIYLSPDDYSEFEGSIEEIEYLFGKTFATTKTFYLPTNCYNFFLQVKDDQVFLKPNIVHLNKYIFNNNKASLTWLINNNPQVLESLVTDFGYVTDEKLLKWILDRYCVLNSNSPDLRERMKNFLKLFVYRQCDQKCILIRKY